jgi:adenylate kinase
MIVIVTGTPGTGKTFFAKTLCRKYSFEYVDVKKLINQKKLSSGFDNKRNCEIIDVKKLNSELIKVITNANKKKKNLVIDSHLSHFLPKKYVDVCFVTKCSLKELKKRLEKRKYSKDKLRENLDSEIFDNCFIEAEEQGHEVRVIVTTNTTKIKK